MKPRYYVLDADNRPIPVSLLRWGQWFESFSNRIVDYTEITSDVRVSTIFTGLDTWDRDDGPPLLFETNVFGGPLDEGIQRYSSWDDAVIGHAAIARKVRALLDRR